MYWLGKCPPWNRNETFWCPLKWESSQNISYWGRENASVQGQNKTAQPAVFDSSCSFTAPKKCGPGEPRHLLQFSASWWRPNPAPVDGHMPKPWQGWTANHEAGQMLVLKCSTLFCLPQQTSTRRSCWTSWSRSWRIPKHLSGLGYCFPLTSGLLRCWVGKTGGKLDDDCWHPWDFGKSVAWSKQTQGFCFHKSASSSWNPGSSSCKVWGKRTDLWSTSDSQQQLFLLSQIARGTDGDRFFDLEALVLKYFIVLQNTRGCVWNRKSL